jgi:hypothetical protein
MVRYTATNPDRIADKARECRFFLVKMAEFEREMDIEKLLYCLSAFLSAFRAGIYRSIGVVEKRSGKSVVKKYLDDLYKNPEIKFLKQTTDLEVHGDGPKIWQHYRIALVWPNAPRTEESGGPWGSRFGTGKDRFRSHIESRFPESVVSRQPAGWQFEGHPKNLIELCHDALEDLEEAVRKALHP